MASRVMSVRMIALLLVAALPSGNALCDDVQNLPQKSRDVGAANAQYDSMAETSDDDDRSSDSTAGTVIFGLSIMILTVGLTFAVFKCIRQCDQRDVGQRDEPPVSGGRRIRIAAPRPPPVDLEANPEASESIRQAKIIELRIPGICGFGSVPVCVGVVRNLPGSKEYKSPAIRRPSDFQPNANECEKCEFEDELEHVLANRVSPAPFAAGTGVGVSDGVGMGIGMGVGGLEKAHEETAECKYREERNLSDSGSGNGSGSGSGSGENFDMFPSSLGGQRTLGGGGVGMGGYSPV